MIFLNGVAIDPNSSEMKKFWFMVNRAYSENARVTNLYQRFSTFMLSNKLGEDTPNTNTYYATMMKGQTLQSYRCEKVSDDGKSVGFLVDFNESTLRLIK